MAIRLYNTRTRRVEEFRPLEAGKVRMYHCGPTVYSSPHIGNFRAFLLADLLRRFFEDQGLEVTQVMNITDVGHMTDDVADQGEDKLQAAARKAGKDPWAIAAHYTDEFREGLERLHFRMPHHLPKATDHIEEMGEIIAGLLEQGIAYQVGGNVYFDISRFPAYGELSGKVLDELEEGKRIAINEEKKDPRDFALWKTDAAHIMQWDAPFPGGHRGFPGWHIECSAMAMKYLGQSFDLHTGGEDNLFPHHECEVAQSEAYTGKPFAHTWMHVKHLKVEGEKMAKSRGNFYSLQDVFEHPEAGRDPALNLRYTILKVQYRQTLNFTWRGMADSEAARTRVNRARARLQRIVDGAEAAGGDAVGEVVEAAHEGFTAALCDDLDVSGALAAVFGLVTAVNKLQPDAAGAAEALAAFARFENVLGVFGDVPGESAAAGGAEGGMQDLLDQRNAARAAKDFATADRLRDEIQAAGFRIVDAPEGSRLERI